jgi:hypothetical protein
MLWLLKIPFDCCHDLRVSVIPKDALDASNEVSGTCATILIKSKQRPTANANPAYGGE